MVVVVVICSSWKIMVPIPMKVLLAVELWHLGHHVQNYQYNLESLAKQLSLVSFTNLLVKQQIR